MSPAKMHPHPAPGEDDAPARSEASVIELLRAPGRPKGTPKTGGRTKGTRNRRTQAVEEAMRPLVPASKRKLKSLLVSDDPKAALSAAALVLAYVYGKPVERIVSQSEITGRDGAAFMPEPVIRERTILETARAVGFLMNLADRDAGEPSPAPSVPKRGIGPLDCFPFTSSAEPAEPEAEQSRPAAPLPRVEPGSIYTEYQEPLDAELVGKVIIARVRNGRWAALHADTRQPIDPTMGEPAAHIAEAKAKAILAATTAKGGGGGKKSAG